MIKKMTLLFLFTLTVVNAQQLPIDFSSANHNFTGFNGSSFTQRTDPDDSNNTVGEFKNNGAVNTQGFFIDLSTNIDLSIDRSISLSFLFV